MLRYFDETKQVELQSDMSSTGMGAALMQEGTLVAYASRALSRTEEGYAQIEKELWAVV